MVCCETLDRWLRLTARRATTMGCAPALDQRDRATTVTAVKRTRIGRLPDWSAGLCPIFDTRPPDPSRRRPIVRRPLRLHRAWAPWPRACLRHRRHVPNRVSKCRAGARRNGVARSGRGPVGGGERLTKSASDRVDMRCRGSRRAFRRNGQRVGRLDWHPPPRLWASSERRYVASARRTRRICRTVGLRPAPMLHQGGRGEHLPWRGGIRR